MCISSLLQCSWNAPVSIALHAPGTDFVPTIKAIKYLRDCAPGNQLVRQFTTFHIYFSSKHIPKFVRTFYHLPKFQFPKHALISLSLTQFRFQNSTGSWISRATARRLHRHSLTFPPHNCTKRKRNFCTRWMWDETLLATRPWHISCWPATLNCIRIPVWCINFWKWLHATMYRYNGPIRKCFHCLYSRWTAHHKCPGTKPNCKSCWKRANQFLFISACVPAVTGCPNQKNGWPPMKQKVGRFVGSIFVGNSF